MTSDHQQVLRRHVTDTTRRYRAAERARATDATKSLDPEVAHLPVDAGWLSIESVDKSDGGGGFSDVTEVARLLGAELAPFGFAATTAVVLPALAFGSDYCTGLRVAVLAGERNVLALLPQGPRHEVTVTGVTSNGFVVSGMWAHVVHDLEADALLLAVPGEKGLVAVVDANAPGVRIESVPVFDLSRRFASVTLQDVAVSGTAVIETEAAANVLVALLVDRFATLVAADSLGVADRAMQVALEYAKVRRQFDRPIGSFQVIKHRFADMYAKVECARLLVENAGAAITQSEPAESRANKVAMAKAFAADIAAGVTAQVVNIHGGIGYTWEADPHLYLKRAKLNQALAGTTRDHAVSVGRRLVADVAGRSRPEEL